MRAWVVVVFAIVACKSKSPPVDVAPSNKVTPSAFALVKVDAPAVLAPEDAVPPPSLVVLVDEAGRSHVTAVSTWSASVDPSSAKSASLDAIDRFARETRLTGAIPGEAVKKWDPRRDSGPMPSTQDDPPPPEEEDKPDDGEDESGGTGTAMALEEGKMGQKGMHGQRGALWANAPSKRDFDDGQPWRVSKVGGEVMTDGKLTPPRVVIMPSPHAPAAKVIDVLTALSGPIAVTHAGKVRLLRIDFMPAGWDNSWGTIGTARPRWFEARVSAKGIVIEAVPDAPIEVASLDPKQLADAIAKAGTQRGGLDEYAPVDILVDDGVDAQRLVEVLVALDTAGVRVIGLGTAPTADDLKRRGHRLPMVSVGQPNAQGDLDKALIRNVVKQELQKLDACYAKALAKQPELTGTVAVQFFIAPDGKVKAASASGVDPALAKCVADTVKKFEFPKPKGGGGVQVNYPFTFRP